MNLLVDIDGVVRKIVEPCIEIYNRDYDPNAIISVDDIKLYNMKEYFPLVDSIVETFFGKYAKEVFYDLAEPYDDAVDVLNRLHRYHYIHIATHQFSGNEGITLDWLKHIGIPFDAISFTSQKTFLAGHVIVDDKEQTLRDFREHKLYDNMSIVCMSRPWNQDWDGDRINNMLDFEKYIGLMSDHGERSGK